MSGYCSQYRRVGTTDTLRVWKLPGYTPPQKIQHPLFLAVEFFLCLQNLPASSWSHLTKEKPSLTRPINAIHLRATQPSRRAESGTEFTDCITKSKFDL